MFFTHLSQKKYVRYSLYGIEKGKVLLKNSYKAQLHEQSTQLCIENLSLKVAVFTVQSANDCRLFLKVIPGCQNLTGYWAPGHGILVHTCDGRPSKMLSDISSNFEFETV